MIKHSFKAKWWPSKEEFHLVLTVLALGQWNIHKWERKRKLVSHLAKKYRAVEWWCDMTETALDKMFGKTCWKSHLPLSTRLYKVTQLLQTVWLSPIGTGLYYLQGPGVKIMQLNSHHYLPIASMLLLNASTLQQLFWFRPHSCSNILLIS